MTVLQCRKARVTGVSSMGSGLKPRSVLPPSAPDGGAGKAAFGVLGQTWVTHLHLLSPWPVPPSDSTGGDVRSVRSRGLQDWAEGSVRAM